MDQLPRGLEQRLKDGDVSGPVRACQMEAPLRHAWDEEEGDSEGRGGGGMAAPEVLAGAQA